MKSLFKPSNLIPILLIGVMIISAPIFAGIRAAAIGVNIAERWPRYIPLEILSGAALVLMEGGALYVVSSYWRQFKPLTIYWFVLGGIMGVIAFAIPFIVCALFVAAQFNQPIYKVLTWNHIFINHLTWLWSFAVACIPTILVIGLGIAHGIEEELPAIKPELKSNPEELESIAWGILSKSKATGQWIDPVTLARTMQGRVSVQQAKDFSKAWYEATQKRAGVKAEAEQKFMESISLNGNGG